MPPTPGPRTVLHVLDAACQRHPDKVAVRDRDVSHTYQGLFEASARVGGGLASLGVERGSLVGLMVDNHLAAVTTWLGTALVGGAEVPVNTAYKGNMLAHMISDSRASLLVIEDRYCGRLAAIANRVRCLDTVVVVGGSGSSLPAGRFNVVQLSELEASGPCSPASTAASDLFGIFYTSGTTGPSKGVLVPHGHAHSFATPEYLGACDEADVSLVTLPLFHVGGQLWGVYNALQAGATAVIAPAFHASTFWDDARKYGATFTTLVGAMASFLLARPPTPDDRSHPVTRVAITPAIREVDEFATRFGVSLASGFGMSETAMVLVAGFGSVRPQSCGTPRPDFEVMLVDDDDQPVPRGAVGQLAVRPRQPWSMMLGYHGHPEETARAWRNLWFHTGDAFYQDVDGQFIFVDRIKDAIRRRGENVSSIELEAEIRAMTSVLDCAVIAVPSEHSEDEIKAVIVPVADHAVSEEEIVRFLIDRVPYYMVPRYVEIVDNLPRTPTERVRKQELRDAGITPSTWDREAAGIVVTRDGR